MLAPPGQRRSRSKYRRRLGHLCSAQRPLREYPLATDQGKNDHGEGDDMTDIINTNPSEMYDLTPHLRSAHPIHWQLSSGTRPPAWSRTRHTFIMVTVEGYHEGVDGASTSGTSRTRVADRGGC
ncbi:MAG: hypothetical protein R2705_17660 [Ilumatobacteraceae bacterium]